MDYLLFGLCFATLSTHFFCTYFNLVNFLPLSIGITSKFFILILLTKKSIKNILELQTIVPPTKNINFLTLGFTFKTSIKLYKLYFLLSVFFYFSVLFILLYLYIEFFDMTSQFQKLNKINSELDEQHETTQKIIEDLECKLNQYIKKEP